MSEFDDRANRERGQIPHNSPQSTPRNYKITDSIAVYTHLRILVRMRQELGLEAMLEYMDNYVACIAEHNPELGKAVEKALSMMSVRRIYNQAFPK